VVHNGRYLLIILFSVNCCKPMPFKNWFHRLVTAKKLNARGMIRILRVEFILKGKALKATDIMRVLGVGVVESRRAGSRMA